MLNSNNNYDGQNPSQGENRNGDVKQFVSQGDAIYDYERMPAWNGFDEQPTVYQYGDASVWQSNSSDEGCDLSKLAS